MTAPTTTRDNAVLNAVLLDNQNAGAPTLINDALPDEKKGKASAASMAFVLLNTALGAGMLGLPGAYAKAGLYGGTIVCVASSVLSCVGVHLLLEVSDRVGRPASFYSVAQAAAGAKAGVLIDFLIMINAFGSATSYLIVVGDVLPEVAESLHAPSLLHSRNIWMLFMLCVGAPLSFLRDLSALRFTAYVAFVCVVYITVLVGLFAVAPSHFHPCDANSSLALGGHYDADEGSWGDGLAQALGWRTDGGWSGGGGGWGMTPADSAPSGMAAVCGGQVNTLTALPSTLDSMPIFIFAFTCHQNAISISNELDRPTPRRCLIATVIAMLMALVLYLVVGIGGYATYGDGVASDILKAYPEASTLPIIARMAIAFVVTTCYPMQLHPGRGSLLSLLKTFCGDNCLRPLGGADGLPLYVLTTSLLVAASIGVALAVSSLGVILTIIGALCSVSIQFVLPGGCYVLLFREAGWTPKRLLALAQLIAGCIICPLCLVLTFLPVGKS